MSQEPMVVTHDTRVVLEVPDRPVAPVEHPTPPTEAQERLADEVFSHPTGARESDLIAGLLGAQAGMLILHDVLADTFVADEDEEADEPRPCLPDPEPAPGV